MTLKTEQKTAKASDEYFSFQFWLISPEWRFFADPANLIHKASFQCKREAFDFISLASGIKASVASSCFRALKVFRQREIIRKKDDLHLLFAQRLTAMKRERERKKNITWSITNHENISAHSFCHSWNLILVKNRKIKLVLKNLPLNAFSGFLFFPFFVCG